MFKSQIGHKIIHLECVDSTNNYVANLSKENRIVHGTVILADKQTDGRGQRGNKWQTEPYANLIMSIFITPTHLKFPNHLVLNHIVSLSLKKVLSSKLSHVNMKWPNDILAKNKKIAGVLIENTWNSNGLNSSIIGIGINLNQKEFNDKSATSMFLESGKYLNSKILALEICAELELQYNQINVNTIASIKERYDENLWLKGIYSNYTLANGKQLKGKIIKTSNEGELEIEALDKEVFSFANGEISFNERND